MKRTCIEFTYAIGVYVFCFEELRVHIRSDVFVRFVGFYVDPRPYTPDSKNLSPKSLRP